MDSGVSYGEWKQHKPKLAVDLHNSIVQDESADSELISQIEADADKYVSEVNSVFAKVREVLCCVKYRAQLFPAQFNSSFSQNYVYMISC